MQRSLRGLYSKADLFAYIPNESEAVRIAKIKFAPNLSRLLFGDVLFKGNLTEDNGRRIITFNCKRRGRLSRVRAIGLLLSYTGILGRPAYERDLG